MRTGAQAQAVADATGGPRLPGTPRKDGTVPLSRRVAVGADFEAVRTAVEQVSVLYDLFETTPDGDQAPVETGWRVEGAKFEVEWPTDRSVIYSHFGARRFAFNQGLAQVKADLDAHKDNPDHASVGWALGPLRKWFNTVKVDVAPWWAQNSKEAYSSGLADLATALKNWSDSKNGQRKGRPVGFPRYASRKQDPGRVRFTTGAMRLEDDRRHITLPVIGRLRSKENTRRVHLYVSKGTGRILSMTLSEAHGHLFVSVQYAHYTGTHPAVPEKPTVRAGVDLGMRDLATISTVDTATGTTGREVVPAVHALKDSLVALKAAQRKQSRRIHGSRGWEEAKATVSALHRRCGNLRREAAHQVTTHLARTYGQIVVEDLDNAAMSKSLTRSFRRSRADAGLGLIRPMLAYKTRKFGSELVVADRWFPSSQIHYGCGAEKEPCWLQYRTPNMDKHLVCPSTGVLVDRDANAADNLRDWPDLPVDAQLVRRPRSRNRKVDTTARTSTRVLAGGVDVRRSPAREYAVHDEARTRTPRPTA